MIIAAIIIYIIGVWFFWLGSHNNSEIPDIYKYSVPILWPLYLAWYIVCILLLSLIAFLKAVLYDVKNRFFKKGK